MLIKKLIFIIALIPSLMLSGQHVNLIIVDGQSNAKGIFPLADSPYKWRMSGRINGNCEIFDSISNNFRYTCGYLSGKTYGFNSQPSRVLSINPITSLAYMIDSIATKRYFFVMHGIGGSQIAITDTASDWNVNSTGELLDNYLAQINKAIIKLTVKGMVIDTVFRIKFQGENDAIVGSRASVYKVNEEAIIEVIETELSNYHIEHFLIEIIDTYDFSATVNGALASIASERNNVTLIENTNFVYSGVHITNASQIALGQMLWNLIK